MVKYLALLAAITASLVLINSAQARHRRGCASCGVGYVASCPGGVCGVPTYAPAPVKSAKAEGVPSPSDVTTTAPASGQVITSAPAPTRYYATTRRGVFGWRR
jgi:hypothetical protein